MFFLPTMAFSITRDEIISVAETFEFHTWNATASNVFHGTAPDGRRVETPDQNCSLPNKEPGWWSTTQQNTGIPYKWGGFDHLISFDDGISEGKYAGDIWTAKSKGSSHAIGVDCSGFVSRCWQLSTKYGTWTLSEKKFRELSDYSELMRGDILNHPGDHVMLVHEDNPATTVWVIEASGWDWKVSRRNHNTKPLEQAGFKPRTLFSPADVELVIDRSGSMSGSRIEAAKNSAKMFVDFMRVNDKVGVVGFNSAAYVAYPLTQIDESGSVATAAKSVIDSLVASGMTSIGAGIQTGQNQLSGNGANDPVWAMLLLSDGGENTSPMVSDVLPTIPSKTKIYTIGLGSGADAALLGNIASQTGGSYHFAPSEQDLKDIYDSIASEMGGGESLKSVERTIQQGETTQEPVVIDSSVSSATFLIAWGGSDLDLVLIRPDGGIVDPSVAAVDPDIGFVTEATYEFYEVNAPMPGEWIMRTTGVETAPGGESYTASVSVSSAMIFSFELDKQVYLPLDTIKLVTTLEDPLMDIPDPQPILGADVTATANDPYGNVYSIILYDDGFHEDNSANDGVYGNTFSNTTQTGSYSFRVDVSGELNRGGAFTRTATKSIVIAQDSDNDGMNDVWEDIYGLDKYRDDAGEDLDNDLLTNIEGNRSQGLNFSLAT
jgi:hypothetical protein